MSAKIKVPILLILAVIVILAMLRLSVWQLDRAEQKQSKLDQINARAELAPQALSSLVDNITIEGDRYRNVIFTGHYLAEKSIYIDNQVVDGQVGYLVFTPFKLQQDERSVMVNRGWLPVGDSRDVLPGFDTSSATQTLAGRLNDAPEQPPLWNDEYSVAQGKVWAYLPINEYASQMQLKLLPLVIELAPLESKVNSIQKINNIQGSSTDSRINSPINQFKIVRASIDDQWVAKHKGYAFQWLMMAIAFFIACCILLLQTLKRKAKP